MSKVNYVIHLKIIEGAYIAIIKAGDSCGEMLGTRYDLFPSNGGISWGYKGEGVRNLAFAIAAKFCRDPAQIEQYAYNLLDNLLCHLDNDKEHSIESEQIESAGEIS